MNKKRTIRDVAREASLSLSTVSLVLNNRPNVSEETRRKVKQIIAQLDYHPRRSARGLASKTSGNLGFILTDDHFSQAEPFYTKIFLGTEFEARSHNYYVLLTTVRRNIKESKDIPRFLLEENVDGVIIAGKIGSSWVHCIRRLNIPLILIDYELPGENVSSVVIDNRTGVLLMMEHLHKGGHTKIGFIGGDLQHPSISARYAAYREFLEANKLEPHERWISVDEPDTQMLNGYEGAKRIFFGNDDHPTAVFVANDAMAIGCIRYLKEVGLKIPNGVAVVGFDNIEAGLHIEPRLTTVNVHKEEVGSLAVRRITEMIKEKTAVVTKTIAPVELVVRESCGIKREDIVSD